jgi:GntR family transcriptional regulator
MIHFQVDPHSGVPVYRQLMDQVRYHIASGLIKPGEQLPSIRGLAQRLRVNPTTVVKAYGELQHAGVVEMRHGRGAFVSEDGQEAPARERRKVLQRAARQLAVEARQLRAGDDEVLELVREALKQIPGEQPGNAGRKSGEQR